MGQKKENIIRKNVLKKYEWDKQEGKALTNDFLQLSNVIAGLKEDNPKAYTMMLSLIESKLDLEEECKERGIRISRLQRKKG